MIIEPERYFQYTIPKLHTLWNGKIRDFSHQAIAGFRHFISAYQDKKLVVLITEVTRDKLQAYYDAKTKQKSNVSLLELSHAGRWYANGFISAYNFCEQYEKEHPSAKVDFARYANILEQTNETHSSSDNGLNHNYIINIGRIEGIRFYLKEQSISGNIDNTIPSSQPQIEKAKDEEASMVNSTGLTLSQNLKPASKNQRVIHAIEDILKRHKGKKSERTIVGYCMIAIKGLVKDEASDKILTAAFKNDYFPEDDIDKFSASVYRVLRSYSKKGSKMVHNPDEQWGDQKEAILQEVKTQIRKAISSV
ncbi:hypothetical protein HMPREF1981_00126 [Bacteroides pyogenes F0041]|uniref:Uncharacterized protein n=1 Tax=Bacteroides pyogenes F0041 TaxID=1321819 RepID=U2CX20_9BACE|nr:hypothetical protein [Bacteroides pyogenes]ERI89110.1 hypothetical protein HMPREF1981_00126 [Bacteroides pyogenes F0041]MBB3896446.1 hypothetical protein [Bacteroides pyogenes]SUV36119.1 Uncharacterised protein [Bacteroides pyogenes]